MTSGGWTAPGVEPGFGIGMITKIRPGLTVGREPGSGPGRSGHVPPPTYAPGGESLRQAVRRVSGLLADLPARWAGQWVLLIGHVATQHALEHVANGIALEDLVVADFDWREEGWEYRLE